jgi:hypothetical protein
MTQAQLPSNQTLLNGGHVGWYRDIHLANWLWRVMAGVIDYFLVPVPFVFVAAFFEPGGDTLWILVFFVWWLNSGILQGHTGQSVGKRLLGMKIFYPKATRENVFICDFPGVPRCTWRLFAHIFDVIPLYLGLIRPLIHPYRATFADSLSHCFVGRDRHLYLERVAPGDGAFDGPTSFSR